MMVAGLVLVLQVDRILLNFMRKYEYKISKNEKYKSLIGKLNLKAIDNFDN